MGGTLYQENVFGEGETVFQPEPRATMRGKEAVLLGTDPVEPLQAARHGLKHRIPRVDPGPPIT